MAAVFRRKANKRRIRRRIIFIFLLILLVLNLDSIGRAFFPFPYRETTYYYARIYDVDPFLLAAVMKTESNFNSKAVSVRGARGLMQIMPDTGRWVAGQLGESSFHPDRLFEPETSIKFGAWYIADLAKEFRGDSVLILAAYNGGRGNVEEWLDSKNLSGGESNIDYIPFPETRYYIRKVLSYQKIYSRLYSEKTQE